ncbi:MarR family transcriptional regulator [Frankia sp. AgB1.9]|uniref:MarR family winged helix-turn-helix transcriptional regulator n=1 Tax=unclassified Frankia TaxID=2632575 RepID=UPI0035A8EA0E|nr:MarR family transcriptional regulator [Frankia sp. AgW1.1]MBL7552600.1 MarR family transcriptional regulator [Frankia sp. AgB1.9]
MPLVDRGLRGRVDHPPPSLLYSVKRLELAVRAGLDDVLRASGVTTLQYTALTVLERSGEVSAARLARDSFVTPQSMADMLRTLEERGLIRRETNPRNRRESLVQLTAAGSRLLARFAGPVADLERRMTGSLTAAELDQVQASLREMWRALLPAR